MKFAVISDLHFDNAATQAGKPLAQFVQRVITDPTIEFAAVTGDLTDNGFDGVVTCGCLFPIFTPNSSVTGGSADNQLAKFVAAVAAPIDATKKPLYLIPGNHDGYNGASRFPVNDYIAARHGGTHYMVMREGVALLFCDVYPDAAVCTWLRGVIATHDLVASKMPTVVFMHYNLQDEFSDWWTPAEKAAFAATVAGVNVLGIFLGHYHVSYTYNWNGFPVYSTAGTSYAVCEIGSDGKLAVTFEDT